jgi:hypothetical protein
MAHAHDWTHLEYIGLEKCKTPFALTRWSVIGHALTAGQFVTT